MGNKTTYNLKQLVDFGNYMVSKERQDNLLSKKDKNMVWDADLANWHEKNGMIKKYIGKKSR